MFDSLSDKLDLVFKKLRGQGVMTEDNIKDALREVRLALLEADVNFKVVKDFVEKVREKAVGTQVLQSLSPGQQVVKIVHDELVSLMGGGEDNSLDLAAKPPCRDHDGRSSGGREDDYLRQAGPLTSRAQRQKTFDGSGRCLPPAAIEQLKTLGRQLSIEVFDSQADQEPVDICSKALKYAELSGFDTVIFDTAGRHHIDDYLMDELVRSGMRSSREKSFSWRTP